MNREYQIPPIQTFTKQSWTNYRMFSNLNNVLDGRKKYDLEINCTVIFLNKFEQNLVDTIIWKLMVVNNTQLTGANKLRGGDFRQSYKRESRWTFDIQSKHYSVSDTYLKNVTSDLLDDEVFYHGTGERDGPILTDDTRRSEDKPYCI